MERFIYGVFEFFCFSNIEYSYKGILNIIKQVKVCVGYYMLLFILISLDIECDEYENLYSIVIVFLQCN